VLADVALHEEDRLARIDAARDEIDGKCVDLPAELLRVVRHRDGVGVDDAEHRVVLALLDLLPPRANRP